MAEIWKGDRKLRTAIRDKSVKAHGSRHLARTMPDWLGLCLYKDVEPGDSALLSEIAK